MIGMLGTSNYVNYSRRNPKPIFKVCLSYWNIGIVYCTCGHFLRKGRGENQKFIKYTMDLLSIPDYYIKKGRPHGHRYGKKPGDKEYYIAKQLKKKCKKKDFQGIHDRFVEDEQFRSRMIQIGRTEDLCRQMDDLADEDHTRHLTSQEYFCYKSNWWLRSNKIGSDTMPIRRRSNFKQALSTLQQKKKKKLNETNDGHKVLLLHGGVGKVLGGLLIPMKVSMEMNLVLIEQGNLFFKYLEQFFKA